MEYKVEITMNPVYDPESVDEGYRLLSLYLTENHLRNKEQRGNLRIYPPQSRDL